MQLKTLRRQVLRLKRSLAQRPADPMLLEALRGVRQALRTRRQQLRQQVVLARVNRENWPHY